MAVRFKCRFNAGFFLGRQRGRFLFDGLDDVPARRKFAELGRNVLSIPGEGSCAPWHESILAAAAAAGPTQMDKLSELVVSRSEGPAAALVGWAVAAAGLSASMAALMLIGPRLPLAITGPAVVLCCAVFVAWGGRLSASARRRRFGLPSSNSSIRGDAIGWVCSFAAAFALSLLPSGVLGQESTSDIVSAPTGTPPGVIAYATFVACVGVLSGMITATRLRSAGLALSVPGVGFVGMIWTLAWFVVSLVLYFGLSVAGGVTDRIKPSNSAMATVVEPILIVVLCALIGAIGGTVGGMIGEFSLALAREDRFGSAAP